VNPSSGPPFVVSCHENGVLFGLVGGSISEAFKSSCIKGRPGKTDVDEVPGDEGVEAVVVLVGKIDKLRLVSRASGFV
jgi:hypothetical protein